MERISGGGGLCARYTESKKGLSDNAVFDQKLEVKHLAIQIPAGRTFQAEGMLSAETLKQMHVGMFNEQQGGQVTKGNRVKVIGHRRRDDVWGLVVHSGAL